MGLIAAGMLAAGCAAPNKSAVSDGTSSQPTPTPYVAPEADRSQAWRNSTDLPMAIKADALWSKVSDPEAWKEWNPSVTEVAMVGAELREGAMFDWTVDGKKVQSTVLSLVKDQKLVIEGTPFAEKGELEFSIRPFGERTLLHLECRLKPDWKKKEKAALEAFFRDLAGKAQQIK